MGPLRFLVCLVASFAALALQPAISRGQDAMDGLTARNLGQSGMASSVPQAALDVPLRGTCDEPYSDEEANGGTSPCPGVWPSPPGRVTWQPLLHYAAGDTVELTFDVPMLSVRASIVENFDPTISPPCPAPPPGGTPEPCNPQPQHNEYVLAPSDAKATGDPRVWTVVLPTTTKPAYRLDELAFSIAAKPLLGDARGYALGLVMPRFDDAGKTCGTAYYGPGDVENVSCTPGFKGPPPPTTPSGPQPPDVLTLTASGQRAATTFVPSCAWARAPGDAVCAIGYTVPEPPLHVAPRTAIQLGFDLPASAVSARLRNEAGDRDLAVTPDGTLPAENWTLQVPPDAGLGKSELHVLAASKSLFVGALLVQKRVKVAVRVPRLRGLTRRQAKRALAKRGLRGRFPAGRSGVVRSQSPRAGAKVTSGTLVRVTLRRARRSAARP